MVYCATVSGYDKRTMFSHSRKASVPRERHTPLVSCSSTLIDGVSPRFHRSCIVIRRNPTWLVAMYDKTDVCFPWWVTHGLHFNENAELDDTKSGSSSSCTCFLTISKRMNFLIGHFSEARMAYSYLPRVALCHQTWRPLESPSPYHPAHHHGCKTAQT